jgi:putative ABC transport system substrate-binding protein
MNNRRKLVIGLGVSALAWTGTVLSQSKTPPVVIGWFSPGPQLSGRTLLAFKEGMAALGWKEGANYLLEIHWAEGRVDPLPGLAEELAAKKPTVIVAVSVDATIAAAKAAPKVPVVQAIGSSPVDVGLATSLARPGGMVSGITNLSAELSAKSLEMLLAVAPTLKRVGFLVDLGSSRYDYQLQSMRSAAERLRVEARFAEVSKAEEIEPAIARLAKEGVEGLVVLPSIRLFYAERTRIITAAFAHRWPVIARGGAWVRSGALLSYGADILVLCRRAAYYVDRILRGAKPGDLPIEQPTKFVLVVNLKTAKALGLTFPRWMLLQADSVIN